MKENCITVIILDCADILCLDEKIIEIPSMKGLFYYEGELDGNERPCGVGKATGCNGK